MADRRPARPGDRGPTSSYAAEPRRSARSTRSQSREMSEKDIKPPVPKAVARRNGVKTRKIDSALQQELHTVDEDARETNEQYLEGAHNNSGLETKSSGRISEFSGTTARMSGSGADAPEAPSDNLILEALPDLWDNSDKLLRILLPDEYSVDAIARIRDLVQDALQSQKSKQPPQKKESSRFYSNLVRHRKALELQLEYCNPDEPETSFISIEKALAAMRSPENIRITGPRDRRPYALVITANLARLADKTISCSSLDNRKFLEELDACFPQAFTSVSLDNQIKEIGQDVPFTLQLAVDLRIQHAIAQLGTYMMQPNFDSDVWLRQIFYTDDDVLRGWNYGNLRSNELSRNAEIFVRNRLAEITKMTQDAFNGNNSAVTLNRLRERFDWEDSADMTMRWIYQQFFDIKSVVESSGGVTDLVQTIQERIWRGLLGKTDSANTEDRGIEQSHGDQISPALYESLSRRGVETEGEQAAVQKKDKELKLPRFSASSAKSLQGAKSFKTRKAQKANSNTTGAAVRNAVLAPEPQRSALPSLSARSGPPEFAGKVGNQLSLPSDHIQRNDSQHTQQAQHEQIQDDWQPMHDDDDSQELEISSHQPDTLDRILDERDRDLAGQNKENRDQRLYPDLPSVQAPRMIDSQPDARRHVWGSQSSDSNHQQSQISQVSRDMGFQQSQHSDTREPLQQLGKRPPVKPSNTHRSPSKRRRVRGSETFRDYEVTSDNPSTRASQAAPSSSIAVVQLATQSAKEVVAWRGKKLPQSRTEWSDHETECLLRLMAQYGCSWSLLKQMDEKKVLHRRDQVALKDKARNLKMVFLKAGNELPTNFKSVTISQDQINKLDELGIKYDKEAGERIDDNSD